MSLRTVRWFGLACLVWGLPSGRSFADSDPFEGYPLAGPFVSIESICEEMAIPEPKFPPSYTRTPCLDKEVDGVRELLRPKGPLVAVHLLRVQKVEDREEEVKLLLRTDKGWYMARQGVAAGAERARSRITLRSVSLTPMTVSAKDSKARIPLVVWRYSVEVVDDGSGATEAADPAHRAKETIHESQRLLICGLGPSGVPSCVEAQPARVSLVEKAGSKVLRKRQIDYKTRILDNGTIEFSFEPKEAIAIDRTMNDLYITFLRGRHQLRFP